MEIQISDKQKIVIELIDHVKEPPLVDIRSSFLVDVTGPVLDDNGMVRGPGGKVRQETVPTWCRCSQSIAVPFEKWSEFQRIVAAIMPPEKKE